MLHLKDTIPKGPAEGTGNGLLKARWQSEKRNISTPRDDPLNQARTFERLIQKGPRSTNHPQSQSFLPSTLRRLSCCANTRKKRDGGRGSWGGDVTRSVLFVFIPMALKFSKSNRRATDVIQKSVPPRCPAPSRTAFHPLPACSS